MDEQRKSVENEAEVQQQDHTKEPPLVLPKEIGGREGLEPTRYGDWEKDGRCIDF